MSAELARLGTGARKGDHWFELAFGAIDPHSSSNEEVVRVAKESAGQVLERLRKGGVIYALRFRAYGERHYVTLGGEAEGWTRSRARTELKRVMADVKCGSGHRPCVDLVLAGRPVPEARFQTSAHSPPL